MIRPDVIVLWCASALAGAFLTRYHLHMFQQNTYRASEEVRWLKRNAWECAGRVLGVLLAMFVPFWLGCFFYAWTAYGNRPGEARIPLHYTKRVIRLLITLTILFCAVTVPAYLFTQGMLTRILFGIYPLFTPYFIMLANVINRPLEKLITAGYIRDGKKKLARAEHLKVVGITGSYGKTSMKYILETLLKEDYHVLITPGNFNTPLGVIKTIRESLNPLHEIFLCEMGARHVGDIKEICDIVHPFYGVITSVGEQHLETFLTEENIAATKFELFDAASVTTLNMSSPAVAEKRRTLSDTPGKKIIEYGTGEVFTPQEICTTKEGMQFTIQFPNGEKARFTTALLGEHQLVNICGAVSMAWELGVSIPTLTRQIGRLQPVPHRLQLKQMPYGLMIDDAYNANPAGARSALHVLKSFSGYRILITPGMVELGEKQEECNFRFGLEAAETADYIILVTKNALPVERALQSVHYQKYSLVSGLKEAVVLAQSLETEQEKVVLFENDLPDQYN